MIISFCIDVFIFVSFVFWIRVDFDSFMFFCWVVWLGGDVVIVIVWMFFCRVVFEMIVWFLLVVWRMKLLFCFNFFIFNDLCDFFLFVLICLCVRVYVNNDIEDVIVRILSRWMNSFFFIKMGVIMVYK